MGNGDMKQTLATIEKVKVLALAYEQLNNSGVQLRKLNYLDMIRLVREHQFCTSKEWSDFLALNYRYT